MLLSEKLIGVCSLLTSTSRIGKIARHSVFGAESAIRQTHSSERASLGFCAAMGVVDAEALDDGAVGEEKTEGKRTNGTFNNDI